MALNLLRQNLSFLSFSLNFPGYRVILQRPVMLPPETVAISCYEELLDWTGFVLPMAAFSHAHAFLLSTQQSRVRRNAD